MTETYAGITVPEGEPSSLRDCATGFRTAGTGLQGVATDLRAIPGAVADWQGPASTAFGTATLTNGSAIDGAVDAMSVCEQAARDYAEVLQDAQQRARQAIRDARDAQARIDQAEADIDAADSQARTASIAIDNANHQITVAAAAGAPTDAGYAALDEANRRLEAAGTARRDAERRLQAAQDDLRDAQRRGREAEEDARTAARAAAGAFNGVAGGSVAAAVYGGPPQAMGEQILAAVRAGDYSALDDVPLNYLPAAIQRSIGSELADDAQQAALDRDTETLDELGGAIGEHSGDEQLATGFYNRLGGDGAWELMFSLGHLNVAPNEDGFRSDEARELFEPYSSLLATATDSDDLRSDFTDDFLGPPENADQRLGTHELLTAFVMSTAAGAYGSRFLSRVGREVLIDPRDPILNPDAPPHQRASDHQGFMEYLAGNDEAAGLLLAGKHGADDEHPDGYFPNPSILLMDGHYYTDDGEALGALIEAGTHDLRTTNPELASEAAHQVIQVTPAWFEHLPEGAHHAFVTILDDRVADFEYRAVEKVYGDLIDPPEHHMRDLTYEEGEAFLQVLIAEDGTRDQATDIVSARVGDGLYDAAATGDSVHGSRAGALSEMTILATTEANLDDAKARDTLNGLADKTTKYLIDATPIGRVPFKGEVIDPALKAIFPQDAVEKAWESSGRDQIEGLQDVHQMSIRTQVALGTLPPEALDMLSDDGSVNRNFVDGPDNGEDVVMYDSDGDGTKDAPRAWDLDGDGTIEDEEREIDESELFDASNDIPHAASSAMVDLADEVPPSEKD